VPHFQAEVAIFHLDLASEATFNGDQAETSAGRPSRRQGIEVSTFYTPLPWLIVDTDFAFSRARFTDADSGLRYRYFGPRPLLEDGSVRSGPTVLVDARIGYNPTDSLKAQLDIFNMFNSHAHQIDYYYASQLANESAPVNDIHFHPVEPLSFRVTLAATL
jgi:outer membrane receptor protein involved in Fe transport